MVYRLQQGMSTTKTSLDGTMSANCRPIEETYLENKSGPNPTHRNYLLWFAISVLAIT